MSELNTAALMMRLVVVGAGALSLGQCAYAAPLTFQFTGTVDGMLDPAARPAPWDAIAIGDPWTLTYTFETTTPDTQSSPNLGTYDGAILSYSLIVGPVSRNTLSFGEIYIYDEEPGDFDQYELHIFPPGSNPIYLFQLDDSSGNSWSTDALPTNLNLGGFDSAMDLRIAGNGGSWNIRGPVQSFAVIPEPSVTFALLTVLTRVAIGRR
jgi:hypothetical protein